MENHGIGLGEEWIYYGSVFLRRETRGSS